MYLKLYLHVFNKNQISNPSPPLYGFTVSYKSLCHLSRLQLQNSVDDDDDGYYQGNKNIMVS